MDWKPAGEVRPIPDRLYLGKGLDGKAVSLIVWINDDGGGWVELLSGHEYCWLNRGAIVEVADTGEAWT